MSFNDERDYEEEEYNRAMMEREGLEELAAEGLLDDNTVSAYGLNWLDIDYSDDPADHPFDCKCFLCIPGF